MSLSSIFNWIFSSRARTDDQRERLEAYRKELKASMQADLLRAGMGSKGSRRADEQRFIDFYGSVRKTRVTIKDKKD